MEIIRTCLTVLAAPCFPFIYLISICGVSTANRLWFQMKQNILTWSRKIEKLLLVLPSVTTAIIVKLWLFPFQLGLLTGAGGQSGTESEYCARVAAVNRSKMAKVQNPLRYFVDTAYVILFAISSWTVRKRGEGRGKKAAFWIKLLKLCEN